MLILTNGMVTFVDNEDFYCFNKYRWHCIKECGKYRVKRYFDLPKLNGKRREKKKYLSREIMCAPIGMDVDHINHNTLDNTRKNLRVCTHSQNVRNSSIRKDNTTGYKGVYFCKMTSRYLAYINISFHRIRLGYFTTAIDAEIAYNNAAEKYHGEYACINKI
jgi:hypothetical protein